MNREGVKEETNEFLRDVLKFIPDLRLGSGGTSLVGGE